jgi:serine/threonine protein kinase
LKIIKIILIKVKIEGLMLFLGVDEIKLLNYINLNGEVDNHNVLRVYDYFYHKEHLFIVTELLKVK